MTDVYTMDEVARHNHAQDLWIVIHDAVYDITKFFKEHPGGEEVLLQLGGQDATECFDSIGHSQEAINLRESFKIGKLGKSSGGSETKTRMKTTITKTTEVKEPTEEDSQSQKPMAEIPFQNPIFICAIIIYAIIIYYWFDIKL